MFFEGNRIGAVREMILADDDFGRAKRQENRVFVKKTSWVQVARGRRPPSPSGSASSRIHRHHGCGQKKDLSKKIGMSAPAIAKRIHALHEENQFGSPWCASVSVTLRSQQCRLKPSSRLLAGCKRSTRFSQNHGAAVAYARELELQRTSSTPPLLMFVKAWAEKSAKVHSWYHD